MTIKVRELEAKALLRLKSIFAKEREQVIQTEISYLLARALGITRQQLLISRDREVNREVESVFNSYLKRRSEFEPLAYILGEQEFFSLNFKVTKDVLIPRPETELLVEKAIEEIKQKAHIRTVVDVCCGSGAILVSIAKTLNNPNIKYFGLDISAAACEVSRENAKILGVEIEIIESDLLSSLLLNPTYQIEQPALFVSNPPYIPDNEELMLDVQNYEPSLALRGGADGLNLIRRLMEQFSSIVERNPHNILLMEIGRGQSFDVESAARELKLDVLETYLDFQQIPRIIKIGK